MIGSAAASMSTKLFGRIIAADLADGMAVVPLLHPIPPQHQRRLDDRLDHTLLDTALFLLWEAGGW